MSSLKEAVGHELYLLLHQAYAQWDCEGISTEQYKETADYVEKKASELYAQGRICKRHYDMIFEELSANSQAVNDIPDFSST